MTLEDGQNMLDDGSGSTLEESVENHLTAEGGQVHGNLETEHEEQVEVSQPSTTRRGFTAAVAAGIAGIAGCSSGGDTSTPTGTTPNTTNTPTETQETTTTQEPEKSFEEIYDGTFGDDEHALLRKEASKYQDRIESEDYESFSHLLEDLNTELSNIFNMPNDSQELTKRWKQAIHNDIGLSTDEVRVMGRDTAGGGTYTAIFHKNDDGDWVKDLALPASGDGGYLRHNETKEDINFNDEAESGLWNLWKQGKTPTPATLYSALADNDWEDADEDAKRRVMNWTSKGNDHIVVGDDYDEPAVGYSVEAAKAVEGMMNWHENDAFNEEMAMVEQATEAHHNSEEPYLKMEVENGEVTAVPTEEYTGPEEIYLN